MLVSLQVWVCEIKTIHSSEDVSARAEISCRISLLVRSSIKQADAWESDAPLRHYDLRLIRTHAAERKENRSITVLSRYPTTRHHNVELGKKVFSKFLDVALALLNKAFWQSLYCKSL